MKTSIIGLLLAGALVSQVCGAGAGKNFAGQVVAVLDGDTVEVLKDGIAVRIRLFGIDCPEKKQAFGQRAKQFTSGMIFGQEVTVREKGHDRYGRMVGEIFLEDGRSLNHELVRAGMAWWYRQFSPKDAVLEALEKAAQAKKLGLWSDPNPIPPWNWRKQKS